MTINTKFGIGDEVYIVYKENDEVKIFKDEIEEIVIYEVETCYYVRNSCEQIREDELIHIENRDKVIDKIDELLEECEEDNE